MQTGAEAYAAARTVYILTKKPFARTAMRQASGELAKHYGRKKKTEPATSPESPVPATTPTSHA